MVSKESKLCFFLKHVFISMIASSMTEIASVPHCSKLYVSWNMDSVEMSYFVQALNLVSADSIPPGVAGRGYGVSSSLM